MNKIDISKKFLNEKEVSELTGFALPTIRNWRFLRKGPSYIRVGRSIRYELNEVLSYMRKHSVNLELDGTEVS